MIQQVAGAVIAAGVTAVLRHFFAPKGKVDIEWEATFRTALPERSVRAFLRRILVEHTGAAETKTTETIQILHRGDWTIETIPTTRAVSWHDVPVTILVAYAREGFETVASFGYFSLKDVTFNAAAEKFFHSEARREFELIMDAMRATAREHRNRRDPARKRHVDPNADAFAALGLSVTASWSEVQAAYRDACLKFHPDRASAQGVPTHFLELATRRFKEVTEAYQKLKDQMNR